MTITSFESSSNSSICIDAAEVAFAVLTPKSTVIAFRMGYVPQISI